MLSLRTENSFLAIALALVMQKNGYQFLSVNAIAKAITKNSVRTETKSKTIHTNAH